MLALIFSLQQVTNGVRCASAIWKFQAGATQSVPKVWSTGAQCVPNTAARLLGLGLKFCICDRPAPNDLSDFQFDRFTGDMRTKYFVMCHSDPTERHSNDDCEPKIYVRNPAWNPPPATPEMETAVENFQASVASLVHGARLQRFQSNLCRHELQQIRLLHDNKQIIILPSDKNLGPVAMDMDMCVRKVLNEHLLDSNRYELLSPDEAK